MCEHLSFEHTQLEDCEGQIAECDTELEDCEGQIAECDTQLEDCDH